MLLFSGALVAQNFGAGTITGTVTDPNGGAVPGAAVAVRQHQYGGDAVVGDQRSGDLRRAVYAARKL